MPQRLSTHTMAQKVQSALGGVETSRGGSVGWVAHYLPLKWVDMSFRGDRM